MEQIEVRFYYKDGTTSTRDDLSRVLHRIDGPAIDFDALQFWYIDGEHYDEEDFNKLIEEAKQLPLALRLIDPREWVRKL